MRIDQPAFSGSISQDPNNAIVTNLSGSFTGSFAGDLFVSSSDFSTLEVTDKLTVGSSAGTGVTTEVTGSIDSTEGFSVNGTDVLDSAIAFAIALG